MPITPDRLGLALRRHRRLGGLKQDHIAALLGVTQATVSRWERGTHQPDPRQSTRLSALLQAAADGEADRALRRLVETSTLSVHLVCDTSHRLLAASPRRFAEWRRDRDLVGSSLWPFATDAIRVAEAELIGLGWYEPGAAPVLTWTGAGNGRGIRILAGSMLWEHILLADGSSARLVTSLRERETRAFASRWRRTNVSYVAARSGRN
ncbi:helix-turn-helix domain-containing protein [Desertibaculum subflavum]|uniref:helix-turn-helix domain-containing protein n=1 Tax=Desertibaculum subflavum TaxID=2268458 RepID=UPI0034D1E76B